MIKWIKKLKRIVAGYDADYLRLQKQTSNALQLIRKRTKIHADISASAYDANQIIIVGRYRNRDFVQVYSVRSRDIDYVVDLLRNMQKSGEICTIDAEPMSATMIRDSLRKNEWWLK